MTMENDLWMYASHPDSEHWDFVDSKEEAIGEAKCEADDQEGACFAVAQAKKKEPQEVTIAEELLEKFDEEWYENTMDDNYLFDNLSKEVTSDLDVEINKVFSKWCKKHNYKLRDWYTPYNVEKYVLNNNKTWVRKKL